jgi:transcriptional regulator with XRE-family HTH domain
MPRKRKVHTTSSETFGQRLARLRKAAGYSQTDLAAEVGISRRMVAYYEVETDHPPTSLLPALCRALRVTADVLLGLDQSPKKERPSDARLWRRIKELEELSPRERRKVVDVIDALLDRAKAKNSAAA